LARDMLFACRMFRPVASLLVGLAPFFIVIVACNGSSTPDESCGGSPIEPPKGCEAPVWLRQSESSECVVAFAGCLPPTTDDEIWMQFNSLVECQSITCKAGDTRPAGDGCNTCSCSAERPPNLERGYWTCSNDACGSAVPTGEECGYWQGPCKAGEYCAFSPIEDCSSFDAPSICITQPSECTSEEATVCGCNGTTYTNRCEAARAGVGIRDMGACGARAGATCTATEYCAYVVGQHCGEADAEATCKTRPDECVAADAPVCGCDGETYANACEAARAGTGVRNEGACCSE
jgi:hypothetical protein